MLQVQKLEPPMEYMEDVEGQALRECLPSISGTSLLGDALVRLVGVQTVVQEDSSLVVTQLEASRTAAALPAVPGDIIHQVAARSCSWYKDMPLEDIMTHLQVSLLTPNMFIPLPTYRSLSFRSHASLLCSRQGLIPSFPQFFC